MICLALINPIWSYWTDKTLLLVQSNVDYTNLKKKIYNCCCVTKIPDYAYLQILN